MNTFTIRVCDINKLALTDVTAIYSRLCWPDSHRANSMQHELDMRYIDPTPGPHPEMAIALVQCDGELEAWVGSRPWAELFKGEKTTVQTIECFTDPALRRCGYGQLGLQALISAGKIDRELPVAVYHSSVLSIARRAGCKIVLLGNPEP